MSFRIDDEMLKNINCGDKAPSKSDSLNSNIIIQKNKEIVTEKLKERQKNFQMNLCRLEEMESIDIFLILILKNLNQQERYLLLKNLLNMAWDNSNEIFETRLQDYINKKANDEDFKESFDFQSFEWNFNNWKNYFLQIKK